MENTMTDKPVVLVTGASGYIASHIVQQLLETGLYTVRGTVRSLENEQKVAPLRKLCADENVLQLVEAELTDHNSWIEAARGCTFVIHTASPRPAENPEDEKEVIRPAVDGTRHVLKACRTVRTVKRVIVTSSIAAITGDFDTPHKSDIKEIYDEKDWTDTCREDLSPYFKSKPLAEKAAWDYRISLSPDEKFELVVINPAFVMGPVLCGSLTTSMETVKKLLEREMPFLPKLNMNVVDVRDVAHAHIVALTATGTDGHRHIVSAKAMWFREIAQILDAEFKQHGYRVPTITSPDIGVKFLGLFDKTVKMITPMLSRVIHLDTRRMTNVLGIKPRDPKTTIIEMAYSMIENGMVTKTKGYKGPPAT